MFSVVSRLVLTALSAALAFGGATTATADVSGPDVSGHQHPSGYSISWSSTRANGSEFAFVKATEGLGYTNPYFAGDFAALGSADMVRGAYHFARPRAGSADAVAQARHFVSVSGPLNVSGDLPPVLDLERSDGLNPVQLISWTRAYLDEVTRLTNRTPIIYTYPAFWRSSMANTSLFNNYPLWIATYRSQPILVGGWSEYTFWQYTDQTSLPGIVGPVDMSVFHGSSAELRALAQPETAQPETFQRPGVTLPTITAVLSAPMVQRGSSVTLTGTTSPELAGETLYRQGYWSGSWHTWATATVSSTGTYSFAIRPKHEALNIYRVYVKATDEHQAAASPTFTLQAT